MHLHSSLPGKKMGLTSHSISKKVFSYKSLPSIREEDPWRVGAVRDLKNTKEIILNVQSI